MLGPEELQIVRREIDDQQAPARLQDTRCFSDHAMRRIYIMQHLMNDHQISRSVLEGSCRHIPLPDAGHRASIPFQIRPRDGQHVVTEIDPFSLRSKRREEFFEARLGGKLVRLFSVILYNSSFTIVYNA